MVAIAALMLIMYFAMEVSYDSNVEYIVNSQGLNRIKAYYAAKSGTQLSLLRIKIYQQVQQQFGDKMGNTEMLDQLWKFPFAWPMPIPDELNAVDKDSFQKAVKDSSMDASYFVTIEDEGSKIDLNDLNSPSKVLRENAKHQLLNIFEQRKLDNEEFAREYANYRFPELVNNIEDWMSSKVASANGGDKRAKYSELNRDTQDYYPPNRGFRTLSELHMVADMTDELYDLLEPRVTIYGMKGINPNLATKEVLLSLDPAMTSEAVSEIIARRESKDKGGPFQCDQNGGSADFWNFVQTQGVRLRGDPAQIPLTCESIVAFRIRSTGQFASASREIITIVMDLDRTADKIKDLVDKEKKSENNNNENENKAPQKKQKTPPSKGPPRIVYWNER